MKQRNFSIKVFGFLDHQPSLGQGLQNTIDYQTLLAAPNASEYVQPQRCIGPDTKIIDAASRPVIPGFIDGHTHTAILYTADTFRSVIIPGGTTAIVTETSENYVVCGRRGVEDFMASFADQPIHVFGTVPLLRICEQGLVNLKSGPCPLIVS